MRKERGVSTINNTLALSVSTLLLIMIFPIVVNFMTNTNLAVEVNNAVLKVQSAAKAHYARQIENSRCLSASAPSVATLIAQSFLTAENVQGRSFAVNLNYTQSNVGSWNRPILLNVVVSFQSQDDLQRAITGLQPSRRDSATQLTFTSSFSMNPDSRTWSNFNSSTGCFQ